MHQRDAFKGLFAFGGSLAGLDRSQVGNVAAVQANARAFAAEVLATRRKSTSTSNALPASTTMGLGG
jgi:hypothetical protein